MSTISFTPAAPALPRVTGRSVRPTVTVAASSAPATRLRITARGRRVLAGIIALPVAAVLAMGVLGGGAAIASHQQGAPAGTFETVTVMPGDSLWSIAAEVAPQSDPRDVILAISNLNNLGDGTLRAGQSLAIPVEYAPAQ